ncbi:hypothetical protein [Mucilaginibacter celer]|uniref:DUF4062 domain-containing protein n=1 Tax=Mucilaginibacter celer TaxID=2305508 RepID=A0A494W3A6_9SPHI|nr:hypothetical protein [Mucilaginibacter celer]AYL97792.1 hypothetical protein HYN43_021945 [Mucilaginibacter celer]
MSRQTIQIFLASSSELKADREQFMLFINDENIRLNAAGIFLKVVCWENFPNAMSAAGLQAEYNNALRGCDMAVFLVFSKVGKYTNQEFDVAMDAFSTGQAPKIWTYLKNEAVYLDAVEEDDIKSLFDFKRKLRQLQHYPTRYNNIDHLKYQFKTELDRCFPNMPAREETEETTTPVPIQNDEKTQLPSSEQKTAYNEVLSFRLFETIKKTNERARALFGAAEMNGALWENDAGYRKEAKAIIISAYGVLGVKLRKLMAIGVQGDVAENKKNYIVICHLTALRALQLLCFALLSKLWDEKNSERHYDETQINKIRLFFNSPLEMSLTAYRNLLSTLLLMFDENNLEYPISELKGISDKMQPESDFVKACNFLNSLPGSAYTETDCVEAENSLTIVLEHLSFLTNYTMESIKNVEYFGLRNIRQYYIHKYTALGCDENTLIDLVKQQDVPLNTYAVLLKNTKITYQPKLNLFPFIIDANALTSEQGAQIYFYSSANTDGSLKYSFWEDKDKTIVINQPSAENDYNQGSKHFDASRSLDVVTLFKDALQAITGTAPQVA